MHATSLALTHESKLKIVITTLGKHGVAVYTKSGEFTHFEAHSVIESDFKSAVGAGDSFLGGFIYGLSKGADLPTSINYG